MQVAHAQGDELATERPFELARQLGSTSAESFSAGMEILDSWAHRQDQGSVMVVVEDLHWVDEASSKALLSAVQRLDKDRVAVLVTTRPGLHNGWERLRSDPERCLAINLAPFDADEVELFASSVGIDVTPYQAERLRSHTGGHPLYLRTLLGELNPADLRRSDGTLPAPRSLTSSVTARLSETRQPARALVAAMAVINQRAPLMVVARLAGPSVPGRAVRGTSGHRLCPLGSGRTRISCRVRPSALSPGGLRGSLTEPPPRPSSCRCPGHEPGCVARSSGRRRRRCRRSTGGRARDEGATRGRSGSEDGSWTNLSVGVVAQRQRRGCEAQTGGCRLGLCQWRTGESCRSPSIRD